MKTTFTARLLLLSGLFMMMWLAPSALNAQTCGATTIQNLTGCAVKITYSYACPGGGACSSGTLPINPGTFNIPACPCSSGLCSLQVTINKIGSFGVNITVNASNPNDTFPPSYCPGSLGTVSWAANAVAIQ
jgi:hypothetical protein